MPELPEMETYRTLLMETVVRKPVTAVEVTREKTINLAPDSFVQSVTGRQIRNVTRRGKHILFWFDSSRVLLLHLMLGGRMYYGHAQDQPQHQSQVALSFADGHRLFFLGLRLGYLHLLPQPDLQARLDDLGPEPLDATFTIAEFTAALQSKRGPVKFAMVNQRCIAGIGNRYADEICYAAGVLPLRRVVDLNAASMARLYEAMHTILRTAISCGGYMEFQFSRLDHFTGGYNQQFRVYNRGGEPCPRCGTVITKTEHAGRKVFYCGQCQH